MCLYGHMFEVHLVGLETGEMALENKGTPCIEETISFCKIRYSGFLLFTSVVTVAINSYAKAYYLLKLIVESVRELQFHKCISVNL